MLWLNIKRILRSGFVDFWRNAFVSLASTLVLTFTLFVIGSLIFLGAMLDSSLSQIKDKVDINVYFITSAIESDILAIKDKVENLSEVTSVEYVSREQAIADFRERHADDQLIIQSLEELSDNPLGAQLNIKATDPSQYESIAKFLDSGSALGASDGSEIIDRINFFQNQTAIEKLTDIINSMETLSFFIALVLVVISVLITFNTIRLAIFTAKEEIAVMKLVGASNIYVRGPFVVEGTMSGAISAIVAVILFYPLTLWLGPSTETFFGGVSIFEYYLNNFGQIFLMMMFFGVLLGGGSSYLAVRKYLQV